MSTPFLPVPPGDYGGTELMVYELAEGLVQRGHDVTLFATGDSHTRAELRWRFARAQWPPEPLVELTHVGDAMAAIADGHFDVVHAHSATALAFARLIPELRLVYTIHHTRDEQFSAFYSAHPGPQYVAISADQMRREVALPRCEVIHHGVTPLRYEATASAEDYLCFVGRMSEIKGPHTAIDVAGDAGRPVRVAGQVHPPDRAFAERELSWRLTLPHVGDLGPVNAEQKRVLLRDARGLLAPITWNEPFGLILIEAMLSGCPVVAFPRGSVPELVEPGVTGFIVRDREEMVDLVRRGGPLDDFDRLRCRARAVERFSAERMVRDHERLYERVLAGLHNTQTV
jgi:glycosyltransferase involved in cell wall biosynthesis